jgi:S-methylmethionine-dependent homocysteine/selenocysteine methylase
VSYQFIEDKLARGETIIMDGGTGTDIQRRGAPMSGAVWCADANLTHSHIVRAVHDEYIRVGADMITANTFASSALSFNYFKRDDDLLLVDQAAVREAKAAAVGHNVAVAGSVSTMRPVVAGSDRTDLSTDWSEAEARALFKRKVENLKACGVDLIMMEMMRDADYSVWATDEALKTGLPVWIGISVERNADGQLVGFGRHDQVLEVFAPVLAALKPKVMSIMHTSPNDTDEALKILRKSWSGPMGTYPECGFFKAPDWQFVDVITPDDLVSKSRDWQKLGVSAFGGCCGIGPEHINQLSRHMK